MSQLNISIRIILAFTTIILFSFIPDLFHGFFGDTFCNGSSTHYSGKGLHCDFGIGHLPTWHYGYRHWLFNLMGFMLFTVQVVFTISKLNKNETK